MMNGWKFLKAVSISLNPKTGNLSATCWPTQRQRLNRSARNLVSAVLMSEQKNQGLHIAFTTVSGGKCRAKRFCDKLLRQAARLYHPAFPEGCCFAFCLQRTR